MQWARARPNFWGALRFEANFLVLAVATLCRLDWLRVEVAHQFAGHGNCTQKIIAADRRAP